MNIVCKIGSQIPLTPEDLAREANTITKGKPFTPADFRGINSRIVGVGHCYCGGNGEFELLPVFAPAVKEGMKRYMVCRKCGAYSHL